jgi:hypothetical protein
MTRKSSFVALCILGAAGALGACCCCSGFFDDDDAAANPNANPGAPGHVHHHGGGYWFHWSSWSHSTSPTGVGTAHPASGTTHGGFGSTAHAGSSSGASGAGG